MQGFVDVCEGQLHFASKTAITTHMPNTYYAVCSVLFESVNEIRTGFLTVDGWSAALGTPILGVTWHFGYKSEERSNFKLEYWRHIKESITATGLRRGGSQSKQYH